MLNLLPEEHKKAYKYAKANVKIGNWIAVFVITILGLLAIVTYGLINMQSASVTYQKHIVLMNKTLSSENLNYTKQEVVNISSSLRLAVQVLSHEVLFSKLLQQIGSVMPTGTVLTGLNIDQTTGGLNLTAASTNYQSATQMQVNLTSPPSSIFSKVDIISINCPSGTTSNGSLGYPCTVNLRALFNTNNQFLFINQGGAK